MQDAHCHFHFQEIQSSCLRFLESAPPDYRCIVNGTHPEDWDAVIALHERFPNTVIPALGVHPWRVGDAPNEAHTNLLRTKLNANPHCQVGEIGLDLWIQDSDFTRQQSFFSKQLSVAAALKRPATIHCLRAWDALHATLEYAALPPSLLIHAFNGRLQDIAPLVQRGAYFSFSTSFLGPNKSRQRHLFREIPIDRILVETDAPSMPPPLDHPCTQRIDGHYNHPANLAAAVEDLAALLDQNPSLLARQLRTNFSRFCLFTQ